jgi:uncharacterized HhH-GPD family protein
MELHLTGDEVADSLLSSNPLALLLGMVLDQQIPLEWAFAGPATLAARLGHDLDASELANMDPAALRSLFTAKPALHRYPGSMADRCQAVCQVIVDEYHGDPAAIWETAPDGATLLKRMKALPGFGDMKAKIFIALLGKQCGLTVPGWQDVAAPYSEPGSHRSVADIVDPASLDAVRAFKAAMKQAAKAEK